MFYYVTNWNVVSSCFSFFLCFAFPFKHGFSLIFFEFMYFTNFCSSIINTILIVTCKNVIYLLLHTYIYLWNTDFFFPPYVNTMSKLGAWIFICDSCFLLKKSHCHQCFLRAFWFCKRALLLPLLAGNPQPDWQVWRCGRSCKSDFLCWLHFSGSGSSVISGCHGNKGKCQQVNTFCCAFVCILPHL